MQIGLYFLIITSNLWNRLFRAGENSVLTIELVSIHIEYFQ